MNRILYYITLGSLFGITIKYLFFVKSEYPIAVIFLILALLYAEVFKEDR